MSFSMTQSKDGWVLFSLGLALITAGTVLVFAPADAQQTDSSPLGAFAFADSSGANILALSPLAAPENIRVLLAAEGRQFPVEYVEKREHSKSGSGRALASNFEHLGGHLFRIKGGRIWPDEVGFLATDSLLAMVLPLPLERDFETLEVSQKDRIAAIKGREIRRRWRLGSLSYWGDVILYEFVPQGRDYLASIVLSDHGDFLTHDYPAELIDSTSVWRVDDEGKFCGECFEVLFVLKGQSRYGMAISWGAFEGESLELLWSENATEFKSVLSSYRYWSPG